MFKRLLGLNHISRSVRIVPVLIFFLNLSHCWRSFSVKFSDPIYTNLAPEIFEMNCTIDRSGRISFYINVKRDLEYTFIHVLLVFDGEDIGRQNVVYTNKTVDLCSFLNKRKGSILLKYLFDIGERFGELAKRCPIRKKLFYAVNVKVVPNYLPPFLPLGNGTMTFIIMVKLHGNKELKTCTKTSISFKLENEFKRNRKPMSN